MDNNLRRIALAFLASRAPAAYTARAMAVRISTSGLVDAPVASDAIEEVLRGMAGREHWVNVDIDPTTKEAGWYATDAGIQQWVVGGRLAVE